VHVPDPSNAYVNSVTILNGKDNIWNEDYHVVHHTSPCHWTEYPDRYEKHKADYIKSKATIFKVGEGEGGLLASRGGCGAPGCFCGNGWVPPRQECEEGELLYWLLSHQWDELANHFVDLEDKLTHEEKKALLLERLRATISKVPEQAEKAK
jgi:hypothetical protein